MRTRKKSWHFTVRIKVETEYVFRHVSAWSSAEAEMLIGGRKIEEADEVHTNQYVVGSSRETGSDENDGNTDGGQAAGGPMD